jgi:hypothetical protein
MITVVNGFFCENGCDVAKAKRGEDPHPKIDPQTGQPEKKGALQEAREPEAVTFGGALSDLSASQRVSGVAASDTGQSVSFQTQGLSVDLLV